MSTEEQILQILQKSPESRLADLVEGTGSSRQMVHRAIKRLLEKKLLEKIGLAPRTYYRLRAPGTSEIVEINNEDAAFLREHFLLITETGTRLEGTEAFAHWCKRQKLPVQKTILEFITTRKKYLAYFQPNGLINGLQKIQSTRSLQKIGLDEVYYLDFYAIERFGKTRLGTLLHLAKQGQNRKLMDEIIELSRERIYRLVKDQKADAVGYIPPTIKRELQFMKVLERKLNLALPQIGILKVSGPIVVPQKSLSNIEERVNNARTSIMVSEKRAFKNVLLIDDAIGSGATMNETALKLKAQSITEKITGLAITGSFKGFDIIQEV